MLTGAQMRRLIEALGGEAPDDPSRLVEDVDGVCWQVRAMWRPGCRRSNDEAGLRLPPLKPGQARGPRGSVPWWVRAMRRAKRVARRSAASRRRASTAAGRPGVAGQGVRLYGRRSVVKASFRRNRGNGGWVRHARYLAREHAQRDMSPRARISTRRTRRPRYRDDGARVGARTMNWCGH